ncbi:unnamed protein product [Paramecium octaurelia]|uniref:Uncharacterized protein n=1 Tax=Paramecium octaurelia TaxID=43137 RepID=A0A8S1V2D2_PAROT|nr:unnamed protein product [Paramecium octaurelia]
MSTSNNQTGEQKTMAIFQTTHEIKFNEPKNNERQQKQNEILSKIDQNIKEYIELSFENCNQDCQKKIAEVQKNIKDVLIQHSLGQNNWNPSQKNPQFCQGPRLQVSNQIINNGKFPQSRNYTQQQTTNMNNFNSGQ